MKTETQELLTNMRMLSVLARIKNQIKEKMDFTNPCIACSEWDYCTMQGKNQAYEDVLFIIDEEIKSMTKD